MEQTKKRKFNVIDVIFIVIILAVIAAVVWKFVGNTTAKTTTATYTVVLHSDDIPTDALKGFKVGDTVLDETEKEFGRIVDISTGESRVHGYDDEGRDVLSAREDYSSVDVTLEVTASGRDHFLSLNGKKYSINTSFTAICGMSKMWVRISDIQPK